MILLVAFKLLKLRKLLIDEMIEGIDAGIYDNTQQAIDAMIARKKEVTQITIDRVLGEGQR